jgi:hypothetical protein
MNLSCYRPTRPNADYEKNITFILPEILILIMAIMKIRGGDLEFVGMSSVGPSIAVVTGKNRADMEKLLKPMGLTIAISTKVDNSGLAITRKTR